MDEFTESISQIVPCREKIINELYGYMGYSDECFPESLFLVGHTGTGKTFLINTILEHLNYKFAIVNCIECYTSKILFESLLNILSGHKLSVENDFTPFTKCDSVDDFLAGLRSIVKNDTDQRIMVPYVIVVDKAERLREMDHNILPAFLRLRELTNLNICSVLLSDIVFEKFHNKTGLAEPIVINIPQYTKDQLLQILMLDFPYSKNLLNKYFKKNQSVDEEMVSSIVEGLGEDFYMNFLNVFLNVFFRACRDLPELRHMARSCYTLYCDPVMNGTIQKNDVSRLWRNISPILKNALGTIYLRVGDQGIISNEVQEGPIESKLDEKGSTKSLIHNVELPYYAKYLLIAAYLASYNPAKEDKRLFVKHHGKQRKRVQTINARAKVSEKMNTQLGPKVFTLDRLLAIFYAILEERVGLTCNLLAQVSSLVQLQLLVSVGGECSIDAAKYQCAVGLDFIQGVAKSVGFNVRKYLFDFM